MKFTNDLKAAIRARIDGEFDNPLLTAFGFLSADMTNDILLMIATSLGQQQPENLHVFRVIHFGQTAALPSRTRIYSERFKQFITVNNSAEKFDDANTAQERAVIELKERGFNIVSIGEGNGCMYVISNTFEPLKK